jgi:hypothetical protein
MTKQLSPKSFFFKKISTELNEAKSMRSIMGKQSPIIGIFTGIKTKKACQFNDKPFVAERPGLFRFAP